MKKRKGKIIIIIALIFIITLSIFGYLVISDLKQESLLKQNIIL